eukprot:scaffold78682_cov50-Phaeocystis_antarctica.AAC.3
MQHIGTVSALGSGAPPRHGDSRIGTAVAAVVERGHGDGVDAAHRLREAEKRDVVSITSRDVVWVLERLGD